MNLWLPSGVGIAAGALVACGGAQPAQTDADAEQPRYPRFLEEAADRGLDFRHGSGVEGDFHMPEIIGSGAAVFDFDADGDTDVYLINSGRFDRDKPEDGSGANRLYRREADGTFVDVTDDAGLGDAGYGMGCALGDIDNDGDTDLFVTNYGRDALYRNNGDGTFEDITDEAGIASDGWSTSAVFFDFDLDGFLDLYVTTYLNYSPPKSCLHATSRKDYCGPDNFAAIPDLLYRNHGDGTFQDVSTSSGIGVAASKGLGVYAADFTGDGVDDIYVANDGVDNQLWINHGNGRFSDRAVVLGAAVNIEGKPEASMGIAAGDIDADTDLDLFVTHLDRETNTLYSNGENRWFEDTTAARGLAQPSLPWTGFGTEFLDLDLDGDLDLAVVNGRVRLGQSAPTQVPAEDFLRASYAEPNQLFVNDGSGRFDSVQITGEVTNALEISRSLIVYDEDLDGDLDLLVTNNNGPVQLFINEAPSAGQWLRVRVLGANRNRSAIGALVQVHAGHSVQTRHITTNASYLAARDPVAHFGLGRHRRVDRIRVRWPGGTWEEFPGSPANREVKLVRGHGGS